MSQPQKTPEQIDAMRQGGTILATIYEDLKPRVKPGVSELEIDAWVGDEIKKHGAEATYKTAEVGFPANICISVNEQIVHSVPTNYEFQQGDIVSFDLVIAFKGMKTDSAFSMIVGEEASGAKKHLLKKTEQSLYAGIDAIRGEGTRLGDIGAAVESVLSGAKLGIVRELVGHGIGKEMHMPPEVSNWGQAGTGGVLHAGNTIAIEPMAMLGDEHINNNHDDGWTISTRDGSLSAHFEHTVLITDDGVEILTQL